MPTENRVIDTVITSTGISSTVSDYTSQDGTWALNDDTGNFDARYGFETPTGNPTSTQTFRVYIRKDATGGNDPDVRLSLWEGGIEITDQLGGSDDVITSLTGVYVTRTWAASSLSTANGSAVEIRVRQMTGGTGKPADRRYLDIDYIEWQVEYTEGGGPTYYLIT